MAAQIYVVHLQVSPAAALLAAPPVPLQDLLAKLVVSVWFELQARALGAGKNHAISARRPVRNWCCCSPGRNLYSRDTDLSRISGSP